MTEKIAKITNVRLGYEDHGILVCRVMLSYGVSGQGAGDFCLDRYDKKTEERKGTAFGLEWVMRLMAAAGVDEFSKIEGRTVIALIDDRDRVAGLRPLPTEGGREFVFADLVAEYREELTA